MRQFLLIAVIAVLLAAVGCDSSTGESQAALNQAATVAQEAEPAAQAESPPANERQAPEVVEASAAPAAAKGEVGDCPMKKAAGECGKDPADCPFHKAEGEKAGCDCGKGDCPHHKAEAEAAEAPAN